MLIRESFPDYVSSFREHLALFISAIVLGLLALLTFWLNWKIQIPINSSESAASLPSYFVRDFIAVRYGPDGLRIQQLEAKEMRHYTLDNSSQFTVPHFFLTQPGRMAVSVSANQGVAGQNQDSLIFSGNVRVVRTGQRYAKDLFAPPENMELTTSLLEVFPKQELVRTDRFVTVHTARGLLTAVGLEMNNKMHRMHLKSKLHMELLPQATRTKKIY